MDNNQEPRRLYTVAPGANVPVPAARPLDHLGWEQVGDEIIILDVESLQYHTLNATAIAIWLACDGNSTPKQIASKLSVPLEIVEAAVAELGEADLLQSPGNQWDSTFNRRRAGKLIAAGLIGAVGLPVIKSITVPDAASAASPSQCALGFIFNTLGFCNFVCSPFGFLGCACDSVTPGGGYCCVCGGGQGLRSASGGIDSEAFYAKIAEYENTDNLSAGQVNYNEINLDDDWEPVQDEAKSDSTDESVSAPEPIEEVPIEEVEETQPEVVEEQAPPEVQDIPAETGEAAPSQPDESVDTAAEAGEEPTEEANG